LRSGAARPVRARHGAARRARPSHRAYSSTINSMT
jgi:hypothetical protein